VLQHSNNCGHTPLLPNRIVWYSPKGGDICHWSGCVTHNQTWLHISEKILRIRSSLKFSGIDPHKASQKGRQKFWGSHVGKQGIALLGVKRLGNKKCYTYFFTPTHWELTIPPALCRGTAASIYIHQLSPVDGCAVQSLYSHTCTLPFYDIHNRLVKPANKQH